VCTEFARSVSTEYVSTHKLRRDNVEFPLQGVQSDCCKMCTFVRKNSNLA
jgi:hypothetical protein